MQSSIFFILLLEVVGESNCTKVIDFFLQKDTEYYFLVKKGTPKNKELAKMGTKLSRATFRCLLSEQ